jgi:predicted small metal-binding protein
MCQLVYSGCDSAVGAKIDDEVIELARMHQEMAHGVKKISPDLEKKIKKASNPYRQMGTRFERLAVLPLFRLQVSSL